MFPSQLKFGLKGGFQVPTGVNPGQRIMWLLNRIALPYGFLDSFDALPTPFRCVATDLNKAEAVVLDRGNLSLAMRATMAIPAIFTPVQVGDRLMVDGGTLNNIPADVVRQMGADIVIAVDVAADVEGAENARLSLFGVMGKTIDTMMMPGIRASLKSANVVIDPDLRGLTALDWRKSDDLAERGLAASKASADKLLPYRVEESVWLAHQAERARKRANAKPEITYVKVNGVDDGRGSLIKSAVAADPGQPVDVEALELSLANLTGNDLYDTVGYRLEYEDGKPGLVLDVTPKRTRRRSCSSPSTCRTSTPTRSRPTSAFARSSRTWSTPGRRCARTPPSGRTSTSGRSCSSPWAGRTSSSRSAAAGSTSCLGRTSRATPSTGTWTTNSSRNTPSRRPGAEATSGSCRGSNQLRLGYDIQDVRGRLRIGDPVLPEFSGANRFATLRYTFDGFTTPVVPTRGAHVDTYLRRFFDAAQTTTEVPGLEDEHPNTFWQGEVDYWHFFRVDGADRFFYDLAGGTSFGVEPEASTSSRWAVRSASTRSARASFAGRTTCWPPRVT